MQTTNKNNMDVLNCNQSVTFYSIYQKYVALTKFMHHYTNN